MARIDSVPYFCQNIKCRNTFTVGKIYDPWRSSTREDINKKEVCPKCGFLTAEWIDKLGLSEIMEQAVIDHPKLLELKLP